MRSLLVLVLLGGCVMERVYPEYADSYEGSARIFFYRNARGLGLGVMPRVFDAGETIGVVRNGTYFLYVARPGWHEFYVRGETKSARRIFVEAGKSYYFSVEIRLGLLVPQVDLRAETAEEGEGAIYNLNYLQLSDIHGPKVELARTTMKRPKVASSAPVSAPASAPVCGDGKVDPGEQCDDGNAIKGDGCSPRCGLE